MILMRVITKRNMAVLMTLMLLNVIIYIIIIVIMMLREVFILGKILIREGR